MTTVAPAVPWACKPHLDDGLRAAVRARAPREVLTECPAEIEGAHPAGEVSVAEDVSLQHLERVGAGGALEAGIEVERLKPVGDAGHVYGLQEACLVAAPRASESGGDRAKGEKTGDESHANMAPP